MPGYNKALDEIPLSVFDQLEKQIASNQAIDTIKLHQGKISFSPCVDLKAFDEASFPLKAHEHSPAGGLPVLRRALAQLQCRNTGQEIDESRVTITCGASHAIMIALQSFLNPGDEVLILSPQWLFAAGLIASAGGIPVEVPVFVELSRNADFNSVSSITNAISPRTKAIYFNTPNNPTGVSLGRKQIEALAEVAQAHDLWIISDNAYENYDFTAEEFSNIATIAGARERTFSIRTFSKTYAMPGYRVGYVVAPERMAANARKRSLYSTYAVATASQYAALKALETNASAVAQRRQQVIEARDVVAGMLKAPAAPAHGGLYVFLDLSSWRHGNSYALWWLTPT